MNMRLQHRANLPSKSMCDGRNIIVIHFIMAWLGNFIIVVIHFACCTLFCTTRMLAKLLPFDFSFAHGEIRSLQLQLNHTKSACSKMNRTIAQLRSDVNDKMVKKFGMEIDFDEMEEAVLTRLLMNQPKVDDASAKHREMELRKLRVIFLNHKLMFTHPWCMAQILRLH